MNHSHSDNFVATPPWPYFIFARSTGLSHIFQVNYFFKYLVRKKRGLYKDQDRHAHLGKQETVLYRIDHC